MDGWESVSITIVIAQCNFAGRKEAPNVVHGCTTFSFASSALCNDMWRLIHKKQVDVRDETNKHLSRAQEVGWVCVSLSSYPILSYAGYDMPSYALHIFFHTCLSKQGAQVFHTLDRQTSCFYFAFCFLAFVFGG